jgi:D-alanyl-D-alanine carboxypeptidase (penicillin-binding protein 5/6)
MGGSQIFLPADVRLKVRNLLKAVTIASANDASVAVAENIAGTYSNFIGMMNEKANELGLENTHFVNSTGLPEEGNSHYSTARDIAIMARELVKYEQIRKWASTWVDYVSLPDRRAMLVNTNKLIKSYPGMDGLKTGHTSEAGFCLAATAKREKMRLISVVLDAESEIAREEITTRLLDYGFNGFHKKIVIKKGKEIKNIRVPGGKKTVTTAKAVANLPVILQKGSEDDIEINTILLENLKAPVEKGEELGKNVVTLNKNKIGEVKLIATENIEKANIFVRLWRYFVNWIGSWLSTL